MDEIARHRRARSVRLPAACAGHAAHVRRCSVGSRVGDGRPRCAGRRVRPRRGAGRDGRARRGEAPRSVRFAEGKEQLCVFELIYFARPDSYMLGRNLYEARRRMGEAARAGGAGRGGPGDARAGHRAHRPPPAMPRPAASRIARAWSRNRYAGRTFIQPSNGLRQRGVTVKLSALREQVRGKRLVVVDDSIVRGTTTRQIVGAAAPRRSARGPPAHQRAADLQPVLLRHRHADRDGADRSHEVGRGDPRVRRRRLAVVPVDRRRAQALDLPRERFCFACFDGNYPVPVPYDVANHKFLLERRPAGGRRLMGRQAYARLGRRRGGRRPSHRARPPSVADDDRRPIRRTERVRLASRRCPTACGDR